MQTSCLVRLPNDPLLIIRQSYLDFCSDAGNDQTTAAALISVFEYWHNINLKAAARNAERNNITQRGGDGRPAPEDLLQGHSTEDLTRQLMGIAKDKSIRSARKYLRQKGVISEHANPNENYAFDRKIYYLFHPEAINPFLWARKNADPAKMPDALIEPEEMPKRPANADPAKMPDADGENAGSSGKNAGTIVEITKESNIVADSGKTIFYQLTQGMFKGYGERMGKGQVGLFSQIKPDSEVYSKLKALYNSDPAQSRLHMLFEFLEYKKDKGQSYKSASYLAGVIKDFERHTVAECRQALDRCTKAGYMYIFYQKPKAKAKGMFGKYQKNNSPV